MVALNFCLLSFVTFSFWQNWQFNFKQTLIRFSFLLQTGFLLVHTWQTSHFPLSNLYESLLCLSWMLTFLIGWVYSNGLLSYILTPTVVLLQIFIIGLPLRLKSSDVLVPALQSNWLQMHVMVMIGAYACLMVGCLSAIAFLVFNTKFRLHPNGTVLKTWTQTLDNLSYRSIGLGFPLLTAGLLSGAVWANQTWGSYWSWDPKETWALISWMVFAMYLHTRLSKQWTKIQSAWLAVSGWVVLWICYLGVNLMAKGLHSYGFLQ